MPKTKRSKKVKAKDHKVPVKTTKKAPSRKSSTGGYLSMPQRFNKRTATILAAVLAVVGIYIIFFSHAASTPALGVYTGPADVAGVDNFSNWLGNPATYSIQYLDYKQGWNTDFTPNWLFDPWSQWVKTAPGRRLVLGVPMLEQANSGQLAQGASGSFDVYFKNLAQSMVNKGLGGSVIRLGWEANGNWYPWQAAPDPTSWKNYYRRIVSTMRAVPGQSFQFDWTRSSGASGTNLSFADNYPGDDVVDFIGLDRYDVKWQDTTSTPEQRWSWMLSEPMGISDHKAFANLHAKPMSFPEWGLYRAGDTQGGGGDNPYYIDRMADWFASSNVAYQAYFNADWGGGVLANFPNGQARYKARFGGTSTGPTITTVNDNTVGTGTNQFEYSSGWTYESGYSFYYQSDDRYSGIAGTTYKIRFNGNRISLYGATSPNGGIGAISIDGGPETNVDFYSATRNNQAVAFASPVLAEAAHTLSFRVTGTKSPSSTGPYVSIDRADIASGGTTSTDTTPPSAPTSLTAIPQSSSQVNLAWTASTDNVGVSGYDVYRNSVKVTTVATNSYSDSGLAASTAYSYYVVAKDAAGNSSPPSNSASATTLASTPTSDTIAPSVTFTSPVNGSTLIGTSMYIKAQGTDNVKVTKMEIWIDGSRKTSNTNNTAIWYTWSTKKAATGAHIITVKAYDAAGNVGQGSITVYK